MSSPLPLVLVADDDADILFLISELLESSGFRVVCATNGHTALELAEKEDLSLAILDLRMPGLDGVAVTERLRIVPSPRLPILILTASAGDRERQDALAAGADAFVGKPFYPAELLRVARSLSGG